jgi:agmatine deiminase
MLTRRQALYSSAALAAGLMMSNRSRAGDRPSARASGFWMPEESAPHVRTFMQWPVSREVYPDPIFLEMVQQAVADIANAVSGLEPVVMLMDRHFEAGAKRMLGGAIEIWDIPTDDLWCRDSGPTFVVDGKGNLAVSQTNFNGWGNKQIHPNDGRIADRVAARLGLPVFNNHLVGEAGGVESDGSGMLMAHESSWVNKNRNAGTRDAIEALLLGALGATKMIWAPGIEGADITDYHIDALARFIAPGRIVIQMPSEIFPSDPWSKAAFETFEILQDATDANGNKFSFDILPEPYDTRIQAPDFVASYVNYYICNGAVISARFGDGKADEEAADSLQRLYPDREIIALDVDPIGEVGGGVHCATQQQPQV